MAKFKCSKCGLTEHLRENGKLVCELQKGVGGMGTATLDQYYIYCRVCSRVSIFKPGWIGNLKLSHYMEGKTFFDNWGTSHDLFGMYNSVNKAMIEDGIIPKGWTPFN
jgi:hypothetical protein